MPIDAYGYVRVSSSGQVTRYGPDRQREDIAAFAADNGYSLVRLFEDAHKGSEADRPQYMEMLASMMSNGVKVVIVESLDRFARDSALQTVLLSKLAAERLTLIAANTGNDATADMQTDPMKRALVQVQGVFAELDKNLLVRRLKRGREAKRAATGRCEGRKPFGFYEQEQPALCRIKQLRRKPRGAARPSFGTLVKILNTEGLPTRSGKPWTRSTVQKICDTNGWD